MLADYHVHCMFSDDSWYIPAKLCADAWKNNLDEICFTDHVDYGIKPDWDQALTAKVQNLLGGQVSVNDSWGIDHGTWTVFVHMFPDADIPVVQLSVNGRLTPAESYELGKKLTPLRDQGYLIVGSGNVVHNLRQVEWDNEGGTPMTLRFNQQITDAVISGDNRTVIDYAKLPDARYAVPTPDHFLPLLYCLGAAEGDSASVFNNICNLGSMAMTGFVFA